MKTILIKQITAEETITIRHEILRPHGPREDCYYPSDELEDSFHLGVFWGEELVGIASFMVENDPELGNTKMFRLRGMATTPAARGIGAGKLLIIKASDICKEQQATHIWCNAREIAFGFYENLRFKFYSDMFDIPGIGPHKKMHLAL